MLRSPTSETSLFEKWDWHRYSCIFFFLFFFYYYYFYFCNQYKSFNTSIPMYMFHDVKDMHLIGLFFSFSCNGGALF